jgi:hypothetical protein
MGPTGQEAKADDTAVEIEFPTNHAVQVTNRCCCACTNRINRHPENLPKRHSGHDAKR